MELKREVLSVGDSKSERWEKKNGNVNLSFSQTLVETGSIHIPVCIQMDKNLKDDEQD